MDNLRTCQNTGAHAQPVDMCSVIDHWSTTDLIGHIHDLAATDRPDLAAQLRMDLATIRLQAAGSGSPDADLLTEAKQQLAAAAAELATLRRRTAGLRSWLDDVASSSESLRARADQDAHSADDSVARTALVLREVYRAERDAFRNVAAFMDGQAAGTVGHG